MRTLGFPYSLSPTFLKNNQNQTPEENLEILEKVKQKADEAASTPWLTSRWRSAIRTAICGMPTNWSKAFALLADHGPAGDFAGRHGRICHAATDCRSARCRCYGNFDDVEIGVHLHSRPDDAAAKVLAAYDAGCRRFDAALGGLGGCPFAQDVLVGNIPTEVLLQALRSRGATVPITKPVSDLLRMAAEIGDRFSGPKM